MYPAKEARELAILLRISRELDIVGDISATVDNPAELLAWADILKEPAIYAWRAKDSGHRYVEVTADHKRAPIRGCVAAVLHADAHLDFWNALDLEGTAPGQHRILDVQALAAAWAAMPLSPPDAPTKIQTQPADEEAG